MDQPNQESKEQEKTTESNQEITPKETSENQTQTTEQPAEESENKSVVETGLSSLRKRLGLTEKKESAEDPENTEDTDKEENPAKTEEEKKEIKEEKPVKENLSESDLPDEIEIEESGKLIKVVNDLGITVYTTPDKAEEAKKGLLRQADYTKKTQALTEEKKSLEAAKSSFIQQIKEFSKLQEEITLGGTFDKPEPLESEYVDTFADDEEKKEQLNKYREEKSKWLNERDQHLEKRAEILAKRKSADIENETNSKKFIEEFGKEALEEIYPELMEIKSALNTTGTAPFPKDMLRKYYLGSNFDKILQKKVEEATSNILDKIDKGANKSTKVSRTGQPAGDGKSKDRYDEVKEKIQSRRGMW